jgi:hypothetical protein
MKDVSNISSEEELLELRNDGKISEAEYQDLLEAMRKTSLSGDEKLAPEIDQTESKRKQGKKAFVLMLLGIILPLLFFFIIKTLAQPNAGTRIGPWFFLGLAFEIAALTMGIKSWSNDYGKTAAIASGIIIVLAILLII